MGTKNSRLSAALSAAKKRSAERKSKSKRGLTSSRARKLRKEWLASQNFVPTASVKVHKDAIVLARTAWPQCNERVREISAAIRDRASEKIGLVSRRTPDFIEENA